MCLTRRHGAPASQVSEGRMDFALWYITLYLLTPPTIIHEANLLGRPSLRYKHARQTLIDRLKLRRPDAASSDGKRPPASYNSTSIPVTKFGIWSLPTSALHEGEAKRRQGGRQGRTPKKMIIPSIRPRKTSYCSRPTVGQLHLRLSKSVRMRVETPTCQLVHSPPPVIAPASRPSTTS